MALFRLRVFPKKLQDVQCVFGQPKRWELYGELDKRQSSTVSIGGDRSLLSFPLGTLYPP
ncbi:IgaA/UmoB family intracellular growth attenuator [Providencia stuartii]|nr:IgaA/UmoB family intracellular growth attenuator [Providencia stuartii]